MSDADEAMDTAAIAERFVAARLSALALSDYPGPVPVRLDQAYAIQDAAVRLHGGQIAGWKVGRIQPPHDRIYGTTRLVGPIFADTVHDLATAPDMPIFVGGFAAIEAEFLFRLIAGIVPAKRNWSISEALEAVDAVHIGFEVASSPFAGINWLGPVVTASDFGNNNGLIVGPEVADWHDGGFADWDVTTAIDGQLVGSGRASAFPGGCAESVRLLLENLAARGIAVPAGTWVSSGAVSGVHEIAAGSRAVARFGSQFEIACRVTAATPTKNG